jgi:hypothetical protein
MDKFIYLKLANIEGTIQIIINIKKMNNELYYVRVTHCLKPKEDNNTKEPLEVLESINVGEPDENGFMMKNDYIEITFDTMNLVELFVNEIKKLSNTEYLYSYSHDKTFNGGEIFYSNVF